MDKKRPLILISNDDGLDYNGIQSLIKVARRYADVFVAAPAEHQSGKSSAVSLSGPVRVIPVANEPGYTAVKVTGTPADSVKLALSQLMAERQPDLLLAGINHGYNMGVSTLYSGTMACTYEGLMHGVPAVAFSYGSWERDADMSSCEPLVEQVLQRVIDGGLPADVCLNINIPPAEQGIKGIKVTKCDMGRWANEWTRRKADDGTVEYWMGGEYVMADDNDDTTDMYWLRRGYATVTPCHVDQTDFGAMQQVADLLL